MMKGSDLLDRIIKVFSVDSIFLIEDHVTKNLIVKCKFLVNKGRCWCEGEWRGSVYSTEKDDEWSFFTSEMSITEVNENDSLSLSKMHSGHGMYELAKDDFWLIGIMEKFHAKALNKLETHDNPAYYYDFMESLDEKDDKRHTVTRTKLDIFGIEYDRWINGLGVEGITVTFKD